MGVTQLTVSHAGTGDALWRMLSGTPCRNAHSAVPNFANGKLWKVDEVTSHLVWASKSLKGREHPHSPEGLDAFVPHILGSEAASFFGYSFRIGTGATVSSFPRMRFRNQRIQLFNKSLFPKESQHELVGIYFKPNYEGVSYLDRGIYFVERYLRSEWPMEEEGHMFFHDSNYHPLWLIPKSIHRWVQAQARYMREFSDWLEVHRPELAKARVLGTMTHYKTGMIVQESMTLAQALSWEYNLRHDYATGNITMLLKSTARDRIPGNLKLKHYLDEFAGRFQTPSELLAAKLKEKILLENPDRIWGAFEAFNKSIPQTHWSRGLPSLTAQEAMIAMREHLDAVEAIVHRIQNPE